jgi:hypothetical protein
MGFTPHRGFESRPLRSEVSCKSALLPSRLTKSNWQPESDMAAIGSVTPAAEVVAAAIRPVAKRELGSLEPAAAVRAVPRERDLSGGGELVDRGEGEANVVRRPAAIEPSVSLGRRSARRFKARSQSFSELRPRWGAPLARLDHR